MELFETKYWGITPVLIWVSNGNRSLMLAADDFLGSGSYDAIYLIGKAVINGLCCPFREFDHAQNDVIKRLSNGDLDAWGRRNGKGAHEKIPDREWRGLQIYPAGMAETRLWPERSAPHVGRPGTLTRVPGADEEPDPPFWTDVILERAAVLKIWPDPLEELLKNEQSDIVSEPAAGLAEAEMPAPSEPSRRGRRRKYDWDAFHCEVTRIANMPDGLPEVQADLERRMAGWCLQEWGEEPSESMLRMHVFMVYQACRKAENK
jgi:hypothetical protein